MDSPLVRSWRVQLLTGLALLAAAGGLGAWVFARGNTPFSIDAWWNSLLPATAGTSVLFDFSLVMNRVGGTWVGVILVPLLAALALVVLRRPWAAVYFLAASAFSAAAVQVLKSVFGRARPEEILVTSDYGSFPSGHAANAATIAVIAAVIFPRVWVVVAGAVWVVLMAFSRTYLHAHWLTDTLGGALAGAGAAFVVAAVFSALLARDRVRRETRRQGGAGRASGEQDAASRQPLGAPPDET